MGTKYKSTGSAVYVDGNDWSGAINGWGIGWSRDVIEITVISSGDKEYISSKIGADEANAGGFFDYEDDGIQELSYDDINAGGTQTVTFIRSSAAAGADAYVFSGIQTTEPLGASVGNALTWAATWQPSDWGSGVCVAKDLAITSTGAQTGFQITKAVGTSDKAILGLHLTASAGSFGSFAAKVEYSTDSTNGTDGTWADWGTLATGAMAAEGAVFQTETAGAALSADDWLRINCTTLDTITSATVTATVGYRGS